MSQEKRRRHKRDKDSVLIDAEFRIKAEKMVEKFLDSEEISFEFPSVLTNVERAFIHNLAPKYSLKTKSNGFGDNRKLSLYKMVEDENFIHKSANMQLNPATITTMKQFLFKHPEPVEIISETVAKVDVSSFQPFALTCSPAVPPRLINVDQKVARIRQNLTIYQHKDRIMDVINQNRIVLIQGSTGSGKTTQIPQYIMEACSNNNQPCRILCTQPRRISAIASAERVCYERGNQLGTTVGYQIRLDSQISTHSNCIFLTPGVFLRYLMGRMPEKLFKNITHILIDEAHERAKENDFLLTSIRENFAINPNLKLIIMSATMDTAVFHKYFGQCEEISIQTKQFHVDEHYLEDVLKMVNFTNQKVTELNEKYSSGQPIQASQSAFINDDPVDDDLQAYLDELLNNMSTNDNPENYFDEFLYLVLNESVPVNYRHSQTKMTALMIAIGRQWTDMIEKLLNINADPTIKLQVAGYDMNCIDFAEKFYGNDSKMIQLLQTTRQSNDLSRDEAYNKALLNIYQDSTLKTRNNFIVEESIDHELIVQLLKLLHNGTDKKGAILIFLPGFDDILQLSRLISDTISSNESTIFMLHSSMKTDDQKAVFRPTAVNRRKIILSTNIAESSITIDDVIYVIDSGREKQKSYDAISHSSSLRVQWISKASANQRRGRAGRLCDGFVYRIYSRDRFKSMLDVTIPELLRTSLTEVCLQSKLLIEDDDRIESFLLRCIASPAVANIRQSVKYLQKMSALDDNENLTHLGSHLVGMPIEARYGKMLLYSIALKCVDPVLSLVSILTVGDQVFTLPITPSDRYKCEKWKRLVAADSFSDHFLMIKIFNHWLELKNSRKNERKFCEDNFISSNHIEQVKSIRHQILNYLQTSGLLKDNSMDMNKNSGNWSLIKAVIAAGLYPFVARVERQQGKMYSEIDAKLVFHMSSIMFAKKEGFRQTIRNLPFEWNVFEEKNRIGRNSMLKCNTLVGNLTMCLVTGLDLIADSTDDFVTFRVDNFVKFFTFAGDSATISAFRRRLDRLIDRFMSGKNFKHSAVENDLVDAVAEIFSGEDEKNSKVDLSRPLAVTESSESQGSNSWRGNRQHKSDFSRSSRQKDCDSWRSGSQDSKNWNPGSQDSKNWNTGSQDWKRSHDWNSEAQNWKSSDPTYKNTQNDNFGHSSSHSWQPTSNRHQNQFHNQRPSRLERFYILKMNSHRMSVDSVVNLQELDLKIWQFHKIRGNMKSAHAIHIILFSTATKHFLGYGSVCRGPDYSQSMLFHFKKSHFLPLAGLGMTKFAQDIAHPLLHQSFQFHELDATAGRAIIGYFESD